MTLFTTQSLAQQDDEVIADAASRDLALDAPMTCSVDEARGARWCEVTVTVADDRDEASRVVPVGEPMIAREEYPLLVSLWLPDDAGAGAPYPIVVCGHGLGGSRSACRFLGRLAAPFGFATLAVDAVEHGDHPDRTPDSSALDALMALSGFPLVPPIFDPLVLRDSFRQATWDRLQVLRAVQAGWDVEGHGSVDLDGTWVQ